MEWQDLIAEDVLPHASKNKGINLELKIVYACAWDVPLQRTRFAAATHTFL